MAASPEKFYKAVGQAEDELTIMIREALVRERVLQDSKDADAPMQRSRLLSQARKDMQRLLNLEKVLFP